MTLHGACQANDPNADPPTDCQTAFTPSDPSTCPTGCTYSEEGMTIDAGGLTVTSGGAEVHDGLTVVDGGTEVSCTATDPNNAADVLACDAVDVSGSEAAS